MKLLIEISLNNAAFADAPMTEAAGIIRKLADRLEQSCREETLRDSNGNYCGAAVFVDKD